MKIIIRIFALFSALGLNSQNIFNTSGDAFLDGTSLLIERPITSGGWARGATFIQRDSNVVLGGFGMAGSSNNVQRMYMAHGVAPWSSTVGIYIMPNAFTGIGTTAPKEKLHLEGNLLLDSYELGNDNGIFFRENFSSSNKYNLSILNFDHSNSGASPDGLSINAFDGISFSTGSSTRNERMRVDKNGNVGIGTSNPLGKLQVDDGNFNTVLTGNNITFSRDNGPAYIWSRNSGGYLAFGTNGRGHSSANASFVLRPDKNAYFNGKLGIGTINPDMKLSVYSDDEYVSRFHSNDTSNLMTGIRIGRKLSTGGNSYADLVNFSDGFGIGAGYSSSNLPLNTQNKNDIAIYTNYSSRNVGIGTTTPDSKLSVNGTIHSKEVKVDLVGWPDYVFFDNYNLLTLNEVEYFISKNGHLPNIPSADTVEKEGVLLGDMNAKLLQKIEELTLYTIQQEKALQDYRRQLNDQNKEIQVIKLSNQKLQEIQLRLEKIESKR